MTSTSYMIHHPPGRQKRQLTSATGVSTHMKHPDNPNTPVSSPRGAGARAASHSPGGR